MDGAGIENYEQYFITAYFAVFLHVFTWTAIFK